MALSHCRANIWSFETFFKRLLFIWKWHHKEKLVHSTYSNYKDLNHEFTVLGGEIFRRSWSNIDTLRFYYLFWNRFEHWFYERIRFSFMNRNYFSQTPILFWKPFRIKILAPLKRMNLLRSFGVGVSLFDFLIQMSVRGTWHRWRHRFFIGKDHQCNNLESERSRFQLFVFRLLPFIYALFD